VIEAGSSARWGTPNTKRISQEGAPGSAKQWRAKPRMTARDYSLTRLRTTAQIIASRTRGCPYGRGTWKQSRWLPDRSMARSTHPRGPCRSCLAAFWLIVDLRQSRFVRAGQRPPSYTIIFLCAVTGCDGRSS
jgi:hypothetical protein